MKTILAIGISAAALIGASSAASAAECVNGWTMIKDQIPSRCDTLPSAFSGPGPTEESIPVVAEDTATPVIEEPMYTGSITPAAEPLEAESEMPPRAGAPESFTFAASRDECQPGQYWMMELNSGNRPVACD